MKTLKYIISVALVLCCLTSCRDFEEINESPNNVVVNETVPAALMDELICNGAANAQQRFYDTYAELMQYTVVTSSSNEVLHRYYVPPSYIENCWNNWSRWAANADHMEKLAIDQKVDNYRAVAITLRSLYMDMLTATFGPVPFSEAFALREGINKPKFDTEKEVYIRLIEDLEFANKLYGDKKADYNDQPEYQEGNRVYGNTNLAYELKDKLFAGDIKKWRKFNNSLLLRILMRLSERNNEMTIELGESVAEKFKKIIDRRNVGDGANGFRAYPLMESYQDNATVYFSGEAPFQNGWGAYTESTLSGHRGSEQIINMLAKGDPRLFVWFKKYGASIGWQGIKSGYPGDDTLVSGYPIMTVDQIMLSYKLPVSFMRYDEVCFLIAEAYARDKEGWEIISPNMSSIMDWYNKGIRSSCEYWRYIYHDYFGYDGRRNGTMDSKGVYTPHYADFTAFEDPIYDEYIADHQVMTDDAINNYIMNQVPLDVRNPLKSIMEQKYIANFRIACEGYNDYRRTGYPELAIGPAVANNGILPRRLIYPTRLKTTDPEEYDKNLTYLRNTYYDGDDNMLTPVWWSQAGLALEIR